MATSPPSPISSAKIELNGPVLYPAGHEQSGDLAKAVAPFGLMVITCPVYRMVQVPAIAGETLMALDSGAISAALFYSRRTAETFVTLAVPRLGSTAQARLGMLCISAAVAMPLIDAHFVRIGLADQPSEEAMQTLALSFAREQNPA